MLPCLSLLHEMIGIALLEKCLLTTLVVAKRWLHVVLHVMMGIALPEENLLKNPCCCQEVVANVLLKTLLVTKRWLHVGNCVLTWACHGMADGL